MKQNENYSSIICGGILIILILILVNCNKNRRKIVEQFNSNNDLLVAFDSYWDINEIKNKIDCHYFDKKEHPFDFSAENQKLTDLINKFNTAKKHFDGKHSVNEDIGENEKQKNIYLGILPNQRFNGYHGEDGFKLNKDVLRKEIEQIVDVESQQYFFWRWDNDINCVETISVKTGTENHLCYSFYKKPYESRQINDNDSGSNYCRGVFVGDDYIWVLYVFGYITAVVLVIILFRRGFWKENWEKYWEERKYYYILTIFLCSIISISSLITYIIKKI
jgi:hypothetical protein